MASKYRKKPVIIEALQFNGDNFAECEKFIGAKNYDNTLNYPNIKTLEGTMQVSVNDFIIKGVAGEFYPCRPDIFEATYDATWAIKMVFMNYPENTETPASMTSTCSRCGNYWPSCACRPSKESFANIVFTQYPSATTATTTTTSTWSAVCSQCGLPPSSYNNQGICSCYTKRLNVTAGWQCPSCKVIYAPHVDSCECEK